jgi:hypothetical protein
LAPEAGAAELPLFAMSAIRDPDRGIHPHKKASGRVRHLPGVKL